MLWFLSSCFFFFLYILGRKGDESFVGLLIDGWSFVRDE